jgi:tripartite-type tricarboxylate transporter receptor subunit TctC
MKGKAIVRVIGAIVFAAMLLPSTGQSAPYYEGKRVTILVGFTPGGGHDRMARILAKHLPKHIPGKPTILVDNMPGATGMIEANHVYNIAKPDGLTIGTLHGGIIFVQLAKAEGVKFDLTKYAWIGSASSESTVLAVRTDLPFKTFKDLQQSKYQIVLGTTGPADVNGQFPVLLKEYAGINVKMITYPSSADIMLAIERKEIDGRGASYSSVKPFIDRGLVRPLIRCRVSEPGIENLPVDQDVTTSKIGKTVMALLNPAYVMGRPYVMPPNTPDSIVGIWREAFARVVKDPEAAAEGKKLSMSMEYTPADECLKLINYVLTQPPDIVKEVNKFIKF